MPESTMTREEALKWADTQGTYVEKWMAAEIRRLQKELKAVIEHRDAILELWELKEHL